ncbi:MAG: glycosyl hydrolase family 18 protein, partial [Clostridium sp.]
FNGIDIDLEGGSGLSIGSGDSDFKNPTSPLLVNLIDGTRKICDKFGSEFMLTMAPETMYVQAGFSSYGGTAGGYLPLIYALKDKLTYIHVQDYNTGGMLGLDGQNYTSGNADFHVAMTEMLLKGFPIAGNEKNMFPALREDQVMFGIPAASGAAGSGYTPTSEITKAVKYLMTGESYGGRYKLQNKNGYPDFRGLMTWSINWDVSNNFEFSKTYRKLLDNIVVPTYSLIEPTITSGTVSKGNYKLTATVPAKNSAISYKILEGTTVLTSGALSKGEELAKTITYDVQGKTEGNYNYSVVLADKDGKTITSKILTVNVPKPGEEVVIPKSPLPDRIMVGYWHNFVNGAGLIKLSEVSSKWDVINVSFGETFGDKAVVELHPAYNEDEFTQDIKNLQAKGKKVVLSLGGAEGAIKIPTEADRQKFMTSVVGLIDKYGFDGIDIDLEGGSGMILQAGDNDLKNPTTPQIVNFIKSIKELDQKYGRNFIISMAPEVSYVQGGIIAYANNWGAYLPLINAVRDELDYLQVQHYNSGGNRCLDGVSYDEGSADFHVSMIDMLLQGFPIGGNNNN